MGKDCFSKCGHSPVKDFLQNEKGSFQRLWTYSSLKDCLQNEKGICFLVFFAHVDMQLPSERMLV